MVRSAVSKIVWLGRATSTVVGLVILFALAIGAANSAFAHTGVDNKLFHLDHSNKVGTATTPGATTSLISTLADTVKSALVVQNKSGGPALSLGVLSGKPPLTVNASAGTATNFSADKLDGKDSTEFLGKTEKAADTAHADSAEHATSAESATSANSAGDADTLDGQNSTAFLGANQMATDADKLDNKDSADFIERNPSVAQNGSINIDGTLQTSGMLRTGSETGTSQIPHANGSSCGASTARSNLRTRWPRGLTSSGSSATAPTAALESPGTPM